MTIGSQKEWDATEAFCTHAQMAIRIERQSNLDHYNQRNKLPLGEGKRASGTHPKSLQSCSSEHLLVSQTVAPYLFKTLYVQNVNPVKVLPFAD